jgi:seryl-tRNA synthetase
VTIDSVIAAANTLKKVRIEIEGLTNEKNEFNAKIDAVNRKLIELRSEREALIAALKKDAVDL